MMCAAASETTLERIRRLVAQVKEEDLSDCLPDQPLELDSTDRIAMIVELENHFAIEIPEGAVTPEMFESLATLAAAIEAMRP